MSPETLAQVLRFLPEINDPNALVGTNTADDAAVYRISDEQAIVLTVDYFTPVVDDPYYFGVIAAANSLSDIYAMGAKPLFALNVVGFPKKLPSEILATILKGGAEKAREAGIPVLGGHTVDDAEPKYGMVVCGLVHPDKIVKNHPPKIGDSLILTKPLGIGVLTTGMKRGIVPDDIARKAIEVMVTLNDKASEAMLEVGVSAATDITGFGLLGHLKEMLQEEYGAKLNLTRIPVVDGAWEFAGMRVFPGGAKNNLNYLEPHLIFNGDFAEEEKLFLADPQTSGGLLVAVSQDKKGKLLEKLQQKGVLGVEIGIITGNKGKIVVER
ncbi:selenide, water dikinase [Carboxydothermus pertinax]|uniref:Selenide, water dikinase n=2 Tax=Carboxydothermus pertinax TaxID=870242 RepID=A0A1L8CS85_9THEO|nr:selenide, water dikinase [Carboxydothermus pertinax]